MIATPRETGSSPRDRRSCQRRSCPTVPAGYRVIFHLTFRSCWDPERLDATATCTSCRVLKARSCITRCVCCRRKSRTFSLCVFVEGIPTVGGGGVLGQALCIRVVVGWPRHELWPNTSSVRRKRQRPEQEQQLSPMVLEITAAEVIATVCAAGRSPQESISGSCRLRCPDAEYCTCLPKIPLLFEVPR